MNYIGSKYKLLPFILSTVMSVVGRDLSKKVFCDLFAGTGVVARQFKGMCRSVITNDCEYYSYVLNRNYIGNNTLIKNKEKYISKLNKLPIIHNGFIYTNYCMGGSGERQYFSDTNGQKIDTIRLKIEEWKKEQSINDDVYYFLLSSLIEEADQCANTASVYGAYLKKLKKSAQQNFELEAAEFPIGGCHHKVFCEDSNQLIKKIKGDILYLDPPYNARQYGANYHLLNTIAEYKPFIPRGKTGLRAYHKSKYCSRNMVKDVFEDLIKRAQFKYIFLSYNNEGLLSLSDIRHIMEKYGKYGQTHLKYQRFKADKTERRRHKADSTIEYIHILEKTL